MSKSASVPAQPFEAFDPESNGHANATPAWKQEVNQRLAAHRNRRGGVQEELGNRAVENPRTASARAAAAAARVAARYAKAPSYSELLAGEARAVVRAAGAAAEAAREAQAAAQAVLAGLESGPIVSGLWQPEIQNFGNPQVDALQTAASPARWLDEPPVEASTISQAPQGAPWVGAQPRWSEALPPNGQSTGRDVWSEMRIHPNSPSAQSSGPRYDPRLEEEDSLFEETNEGYDGSDPLRGATVDPVQHIPANLIEFPRELVATRKARPRLAEGPHYEASHANEQLSIFEVDPELLASPVYLSDRSMEDVAPPEWASIELDHPERHLGDSAPVASAYGSADTAYTEEVHAGIPALPFGYPEPRQLLRGHFEPELATEAVFGGAVAASSQSWSSAASALEESPSVHSELFVAPISDRLLAILVDGALITLAFVAAAVVVIASTEHPPTGKIAVFAAGLGLVLFAVLYQYLFLSYAEEGTPGMRYARIALCTFDDENPTLEQMRMRIPALLLAAIPCGLGLIWAAFDGEHLGWHDRLTRTYQRKY